MSWEENVRKVEPYVPGEQPKIADMIKLNTNECPYPPAPGVEKRMKEIVYDSFRKYPDPDTSALTECLAEYYHLSPNQVYVGVGSDDVLGTAFLTFFNSKKPILFPDVTYSFYDVWADLYRIPYKTCALDEDFRMNPSDYFKENGGVIFPNPNAPTGVLESLEMVEEILKANPEVVVIVDEAYVDFGGVSCLPLVDKYDNLLVVQTFSKSRAMAGMRIGFAMGNPHLIKFMNDTKFSYNSYTMNIPSQILGVEAVKDEAYFRAMVLKIMDTRERVKDQLKELGFQFTDSTANFIFATHPKVSAEIIFEELKKRKIFVRHWNKPRIENYLRITVGTDQEMEQLVAALKEIIEKETY